MRHSASNSVLCAACLLLAALTSALASARPLSPRRLNINARGTDMAAICVMQTDTLDCDIVGTIVSDFGAKIMDFTFKKGHAKVKNVFAPLNKWYIRHVMQKDLSALFTQLNMQEGEEMMGKRRVITRKNGQLKCENKKYNLTYTLYDENMEP